MIYLSKKVGKACFQHDKAYYDFKGLPRRMPLTLLTNQNMMDINVDLFHWFTIFLIKKAKGGSN